MLLWFRSQSEAGYALLEIARRFFSPWIPSYGQDVQLVFCKTESKREGVRMLALKRILHGSCIALLCSLMHLKNPTVTLGQRCCVVTQFLIDMCIWKFGNQIVYAFCSHLHYCYLVTIAQTDPFLWHSIFHKHIALCVYACVAAMNAQCCLKQLVCVIMHV